MLTKPRAPSHTPAIKVSGVDGLLDKVVATAEEKEEIFMAQAFPSQTMIDGVKFVRRCLLKLSTKPLE